MMVGQVEEAISYGGGGGGNWGGGGGGGSSYSSGLIQSNQQGVRSGNGYVIITITSCSNPYYLSGRVCVCIRGYYMSGGVVCTICPVGSCCPGNLTAATACLGSTAEGGAVLAGRCVGRYIEREKEREIKYERYRKSTLDMRSFVLSETNSSYLIHISAYTLFHRYSFNDGTASDSVGGSA